MAIRKACVMLLLILGKLLLFGGGRSILLVKLVVVRTKIRRRRAEQILLPVIEFELLADRLVPLDHLWVWFRRECLAGDRLREKSSVGAENVPSFDSVLQIRNMLIWVEKDLDCLPSHEAVRL
jgi:hypothetical protein